MLLRQLPDVVVIRFSAVPRQQGNGGLELGRFGRVEIREIFFADRTIETGKAIAPVGIRLVWESYVETRLLLKHRQLLVALFGGVRLRNREFLDRLVPPFVGAVGRPLLEKVELMQFEEYVGFGARSSI